jgi:hypothetical protein
LGSGYHKLGVVEVHQLFPLLNRIFSVGGLSSCVYSLLVLFEREEVRMPEGDRPILGYDPILVGGELHLFFRVIELALCPLFGNLAKEQTLALVFLHLK